MTLETRRYKSRSCIVFYKRGRSRFLGASVKCRQNETFERKKTPCEGFVFDAVSTAKGKALVPDCYKLTISVGPEIDVAEP